MTTSTFTIRTDASQISRLEALAKSTGRSRSFLAADAISTYLDLQEWQVAGIEKAIASIDATGGVDHRDVRAWVDSWGEADKAVKVPKSKRTKSLKP